ncbi:MAG: c-type cytochrome [Gammaproteobacteria bacterium]|nr:c-type cytochrome [Gammaproteobacteria bacterium]
MMKMSRFAMVATLVSGLGFAGSAMALDGKALYEDPMKGGCFTCHGKDAKTPLMPIYPKLAGQTKEYLIQQFNDIKSGARSNGMTAAMKGITGMVSDEEVAAIAEYLSGLN